MAFRENSQARLVTDYLAKGNTLTADQATSKFGVGNPRALFSRIAQTVEAYGNHEVYTIKTARGKTAYGLDSF